MQFGISPVEFHSIYGLPFEWFVLKWECDQYARVQSYFFSTTVSHILKILNDKLVSNTYGYKGREKVFWSYRLQVIQCTGM